MAVAFTLVQLTARSALASAAPASTAASAAGTTAVSAAYSVEDLGVFSDGGTASYATGINATGEISGYGNHGAPGFTAFRWSNGTLSDLGSLGCGSNGNAINDSGNVVGFSNVTCGESDKAGFQAPGATVQDIGSLFAHPTIAYGINGSGQIVGSSVTANGTGRAFISGAGGVGLQQVDLLATGEPPGAATLEAHGVNSAGDVAGIAFFSTQTCGGHDGPFLFSGGTIEELTGLGGCSGEATAVNDSAIAVGFGGVSGGLTHAFSWDGTIHDLGVPTGQALSYALGINNGGTTVGYALASRLSPPVAWVGGTTGGLQLLNDLIDPSLGWNLQVAAGINDSGQIAGYGAHNGLIHAFRLTPLPARTLTGITVTPANAAVAQGATRQFTATGTFSDSSSADITTVVTWSSSATGVASIDASGLLSAVGPGSTTVSASGAVSGSTTATVPRPATLTSIAVTPATPTLPKGATQQFTATGTFSDSSSADITTSVTWSSSKPKVAAIDASGRLSTLTVGKTTVRASVGSVSTSTTVTVGPKRLVSVVISPAGATVSAGASLQFTAKGTFSDGSAKDLTGSGTWSSANTKIATIAAHTGLSKAKKNGATTITFQHGAFNASTTLTVGSQQTF